jgi:transposase
VSAERYRLWTAEQKREIIGKGIKPELTPTEVCRKHGISTGQLYSSRQQLMSVQGAVVGWRGPRFTTVSTSAPAPALAPPSQASLSVPAMHELEAIMV